MTDINTRDVKLQPDQDGLFDLVIEDADIGSVEGFEGAVIVSLFTDARADETLSPNPLNRRGWIGDIETIGEGTSIGSLMWVLDQARLTQDTINNANLYVKEALGWMIINNVAKDVQVEVSSDNMREITINVQITSYDDETSQYFHTWKRTGKINA